MKVEKALNFWVEDMNRKRVPLFIILYKYFNVGNVLLCVICQLNLTLLQRGTKWMTVDIVVVGTYVGSFKQWRCWLIARSFMKDFDVYFLLNTGTAMFFYFGFET